MKNIFFLLTLLTITGSSSLGFSQQKTQRAIFAGGCFWCMQPPYDELAKQGVISTRVGYAGGQKENPSYEEVTAGGTGHREVVEITFDPDRISYQQLLDIFWKNIDPFDAKGQFCDKGESYTSAIFYVDENQRKLADASKEKLIQAKKLSGKIETLILPLSQFYPAESYHQDYYKKNPLRYKFYRSRCGRDQRLKEVWGSK